jgi:hypothetical protein
LFEVVRIDVRGKDNIPDYVRYLHALARAGAADRMVNSQYDARKVITSFKITPSDVLSVPSLEGATSIYLVYVGKEEVKA